MAYVSVMKAGLIEQKRIALDMRRSGATYDAIAAQLDLPLKKVRAILHEALFDAREQVASTAQELRSIEVSRLDALLEAIWIIAMAGDLGAIDRVLRIMERRAKLLGLDVQIDRDENMSPEEIALEAQRVIREAMATSKPPTAA